MKNLVALFLLAFPADGAYNKEGYSCTKDGVTGECILLSQCSSASKDSQDCRSSGSQPVVCCVPSAFNPGLTITTTKRSPTTTEYIPTTADYQYVGETKPEGCAPIKADLTSSKNGRKAWDKCLDYQEQLLFPCQKSNALRGDMVRGNYCYHNADELATGGVNATLHEFPHMVLLRYGDDNQTSSWFCGGTLISENFVLTAGHCISTSTNVLAKYAVLGTLRRSNDANGGHRYKIKRIIKHPDYNPPQKYNDIALLELEKSVSLDQYTIPACLHTGNVIDDSKASATGWGQFDHRGGETADVLQKVILTKFTPVECAHKYEKSHLMPYGFNSNSQTCFGDRETGQDTCDGDSGGPLHVKNKDIACMYTIIGVVSNGKTCGQKDEPGLYTRVDYFIDWIEDIVWPN